MLDFVATVVLVGRSNTSHAACAVGTELLLTSPSECAGVALTLASAAVPVSANASTLGGGGGGGGGAATVDEGFLGQLRGVSGNYNSDALYTFFALTILGGAAGATIIAAFVLVRVRGVSTA